MIYKSKKILLSLTIAHFLCGCSYSYYKYTQENKNIYNLSNGTKNIEINLAPLFYEIENSKKIELSFRFSETLIRAQNLKSIDLNLYSKEVNESKYTKKIPIIKSSITFIYWNGKKTKNNYSENLFLLLDDSINQLPYKDSTIADFVLENTYSLDTLPETLEQKIIIQWKDKEPNIYTNILTKKKMTKEFISGRPYG